ncbi:MAG: hypothetical protein IPN36_16715 [Bacteroidetes bacterium]|nr:hypothetical protein [Bacteroidota bacterium]
MKKGRGATSIDRGVVHTLAQVGTAGITFTQMKGVVFVAGNGSDAGDILTICKRAKRKLVSQVMALELIKIAERRKNPKLEKQFRNTYYCLEQVRVANGRFTVSFVKTVYVLYASQSEKQI